MWLIVGLGNPGNKYLLNRHNVGFLAIDGLLRAVGSPVETTEHKAQVSRFKLDNEQIVTCKPQTYMNKSGESVVALLNYYKISRENLLVIQDDIDQPFGSMKFHKNRGHGGHNGIRNISELLGSPDYIRLKIGVGRPPHPGMEVADYVLQNFSNDEQDQLGQIIEKTHDAIETLIFEGLNKASTLYNGLIK